MKKIMKSVCCLFTILTLLAACGAAGAETVKHERVFAVLNAQGEVQSLTDSIRLENQDALPVLNDRSLLSDIQNVGGHESFSLDGENLVWQADGKDIVYQGTSDKPLPVTPRAILSLDGSPVTAEELAEKQGYAEITVQYATEGATPYLAATLLLLPETGVSNIQLENASLLSFAGKQIILGWGVPGADTQLNLPSSFTVRFEADHAQLNWIMSLISAEPVDFVFRKVESTVSVDARSELDEVIALLKALSEGSDLPETAGLTKNIVPKLRELNSGLTQLNNGSATVASGAASLDDGISKLTTGVASLSSGASSLKKGSATLSEGVENLSAGLSGLKDNSEALNTGADAIFTAALSTANSQLAALKDAGIQAPDLTAENWQETLAALIEKLNPDILKDQPEQQASVLAARESLQALLAQLEQTESFVSGLKAYTAGVAQAADGAASLKDGAASVRDGAASLSDGVTTLSSSTVTLALGAKVLNTGAAKLHDDGTDVLYTTLTGVEQQAAQLLLPLAENQGEKLLSLFESIRDSLKDIGYDLRPESMRTKTVYIIRNDLK